MEQQQGTIERRLACDLLARIRSHGAGAALGALVALTAVILANAFANDPAAPMVHLTPLTAALAFIAVALVAAVALWAVNRARVMARRFEEGLAKGAAIEARLHKAERTLRDAAESISEGFVIYDAEDRLVTCNEAYRRIYPESAAALAPGVRFEEVLRYGLQHGQYEDARGREEEWLAERLRQHQNAVGAVEQRLPDGRWVLVTERRMSDGGIAGLRVDITALKAVQAELRASQERLDRAQLSAGMGSAEHDLRGDPRAEWSDGAYHVFGLVRGADTLSSETLLALVHDEDRERVAAEMTPARLRHKPQAMEFRIVRPDGRTRTIRREGSIVVDETGAPARLLVTFRDVTELRAAEERQWLLERQLLHAQKLEALGTLAGGIAHDLNNTLVPVLALAKLTAKRLPEDSRERANLGTILRASERARDLVRQILAFSRKEAPTRRVVELPSLIRESLKMLVASIPSTIHICEKLDEVPAVLADPGQLHQIMINLVVNAAQAIGDKTGTITVELGLDDGKRLDQVPGTTPTRAVRLSIQDTGVGMEEAVMQRIFEPFFTTKAVGEGTGLGLSVVHGIVAEHGGRMTVESKLGHGTRFNVFLPVLSEAEIARLGEEKAA